jgi:hypothetical protein
MAGFVNRFRLLVKWTLADSKRLRYITTRLAFKSASVTVVSEPAKRHGIAVTVNVALE